MSKRKAAPYEAAAESPSTTGQQAGMDSNKSSLKAAGWMLAAIALFLLMAVSGRVVTSEINVFQAMEMRSVIAFFMLLPLVFREGGIRSMRTSIPLRHVGRNAVHYAGQYLWLMGLTLIPLAQVISIEFTAPIWTAFLAAIFLGEHVTWRKGAVILFGLAGVLLIVRPGAVPLNPGHLVTLGAALAFALTYIVTKSLTRFDNATKILFWMLIVQSIIGLLPALRVWVWPGASTWPWIFLFAFAGSFAHFCMAAALHNGEVTFVMPIDYLRMPLSALLGYLLYAEAVDGFTAIGAMLIVMGNLFNLGRQKAGKVEEGLT